MLSERLFARTSTWTRLASLRQKHRGLARRVGAADDDDLVAVAELRFLHEGRVVVDAGTFELREIRERRLTVSGSCGDDHRASRDASRRRPVSRRRAVRSQVSSAAPFAIMTSAPNFCAWA